MFLEEAVDTLNTMDLSIKSHFHQDALAYITCIVETFQQVETKKVINRSYICKK